MWKLVTILSLLLSTGLGFWLFSTHEHTPFALHVVFLVLVFAFLIGLLHGIRKRLEYWMQSHNSEDEAVTQEVHSNNDRPIPDGTESGRNESR